MLSLSKTIRFLLFSVFSLPINGIVAQKTQIAKLPDHLKEISGLVFLNDTVLATHNDSGNEPVLYFLNLEGEEIHSVIVENATNKDWEDITTDGKGTLYIGDIGNNDNKRTDLCIYKINAKEILKIKTVKAEKISFSYPDQQAFPPEPKDLHYDSEALAFYNDSLYIFTKCRTKPWDGKSFCYSLPAKTGTVTATKQSEVPIGRKGWWKDAITSVEIKNQKCYFLTYNRVIIYTIENGHFKYDSKILLGPIAQYESITVNSKELIYIANEKNKLLGGPNLFIIKQQKKKNED